MEYGSETLEKLIELLSKLPGIGVKSAQRIALHLLEDSGEDGENLAKTIMELKARVGHCSICFNLTEDDPCIFCRDEKRDHRLICVVEEPKDLMAIERAGGYRGLYHVLGGVLSPLDGVGEGDLHIKELLDRMNPDVAEVVIATNPTVEGEMTAAFLVNQLKARDIRVTRIARGIPFGGALEFNDAVTVGKAMEGRVDI